MGKMVQGKREASEPYAEEGAAYTRDKIMQQDVTLNVVDQDKFGSMVSYVFDQKSDNISLGLVEQGLAKVHWSAEKHSSYQALIEYESKAKAANLRLWKNWTGDEEDEGQKPMGPASTITREPTTVLISDIRVPDESTTIYVSVQAETAESTIEKIQMELDAQLTANPPLVGSFKPKNRDTIAAKWPVDNRWYRAKVDKMESAEGKVYVTFLDFGNADDFKYLDRVAKLPASVDLSTYPAQSKLVALAFVEYPKNQNEYRQVIHNALCEETLNHKVKMLVKYSMQGTDYVTMTENDNDLLIPIISNGNLCAAERCPENFKKDLTVYKKEEKQALRGHYGIWRYGDIRDDEM